MERTDVPRPDLAYIVSQTLGIDADYQKMISCPFHEDKTPSMKLYEDGHFHCFSCNRHGDVYDFVGMQKYGDGWNSHDTGQFLNVLDDLRGTPKKYKVVPKVTFVEEDNSKETLDTLKWVARVYHDNLLWGKSKDAVNARNYLNERGFDERVQKALGLGFSSRNILLEMSYSLDPEIRTQRIQKLKDLNLVFESKKDGELFEFFNRRVIFPDVDLKLPFSPANRNQVNVFGMSGRSINPKTNKRWLNLIGRAKRAYMIDICDTDKPLYITESIPDAVSIFKVGYQAVAVRGTKMTPSIAEKLIPFRTIFIVPQNDAPSQKAAEEWMTILPRAKIIALDYDPERKEKDVNDILRLEPETSLDVKMMMANTVPLSLPQYLEKCVYE